MHVIDNRNPANPVNVAFIEVPGSRDMAVRDNILFVDMYMDLVGIDISDLNNPVLVCREENVFKSFFHQAGELGFIVEYIPTEVVRTIDCSDARWGLGWFIDDGLWARIDFMSTADVMTFSTASAQSAGSQSSPSPGGTGIAGSMARFAIAKDHLYTLDQSQMHVFAIASGCLSKQNTVQTQWGIETLFPYGNYLFIGANNGMYIYNNSNPAAPSFTSQFTHAQACDPVFVTDDYAYVTLRDGTNCLNFINQLDVVDIRSINNPKLVKTYPMQHPHGLSVIGNTLFLCEGNHGLKVFDVADVRRISERQLDHIKGLNAFDVIVLPPGDLVMVIGQNGLYQYDASDRSKLTEVSRIQVNRS